MQVLLEPHNQNNYDHARDYQGHISLQEFRYFHARSGIGLLQVSVESPAPSGHAKKQENQRAGRQKQIVMQGQIKRSRDIGKRRGKISKSFPRGENKEEFPKAFQR